MSDLLSHHTSVIHVEREQDSSPAAYVRAKQHD